MSELFVVKIGVSKEQGVKLDEIVKKIRERDASFKADWITPEERHQGKYCSILNIYCPTKNEAHKKGTWFAKKTNLGLSYWVTEE